MEPVVWRGFPISDGGLVLLGRFPRRASLARGFCGGVTLLERGPPFLRRLPCRKIRVRRDPSSREATK